MNDAKYIGLDVHQATISVAVRDSAGKLVIEAILETKAETVATLQLGEAVRIVGLYLRDDGQFAATSATVCMRDADCPLFSLPARAPL